MAGECIVRSPFIVHPESAFFLEKSALFTPKKRTITPEKAHHYPRKNQSKNAQISPVFSNDKNIETIGQLVEVLKHYIGLQTKYAKLDVIDKIVRLLTAAAMTLVLSLLLLLTLIYVSFAVGYGLQPLVGGGVAFTIVAGFYLLAFILCIVFRKRWLERPLVRFIANILMQE